MSVMEIITSKENQYTVFYGIFGEAIKRVASTRDGSNHPLLDVVNRGEEALWEKELQEAMNILGLTSTNEFIKAYNLHPNHIASSAVSFRSFMAEIYVLFSLHSLGFKNIDKIKIIGNTANPDYTAERDGIKFVIEVWMREQDEKAEEFARVYIPGRGKGPYNLTEIEKYFEDIVEKNLRKFERQMQGYGNFKKIAAIYYPGQMLSLLPDKQNLDSIGQRLLKKTNDKVNYFLFRFELESLKDNTKTFVVPELSKKETSN